MSSNFPSLQADVPCRTATQAVPRRSILVIEDDFLLRSAVVDVLCRHGFTTFEAPDTGKACDVLDREAIDLLFTDICLPGFMDGLALAALVRKTRPTLKIIVASGHSPVRNDPDIADAWLSKPYPFDHMVVVIDRLLGKGAAAPARRSSFACDMAVPRSVLTGL